jgi:uncharacterized membrane protein YgcG
MKTVLSTTLLLALIIGFSGCKSGKKSYLAGNYHQSVLESVNRLRKSPKNKKAGETLQNAYPLAVSTIEQDIDNTIRANADLKWRTVLNYYGQLNHMYDQIQRSPVARSLVPDAKNYYDKVEEVKGFAAAESYDKGIEALNKNTRRDAKVAFNYFGYSLSVIPNYKDAYEMQLKAKEMATVHAMVSQMPLPASFSLSGDYFQNKIEEFVNTQGAQMEFVEFYNEGEVVSEDFRPDHIIRLQFDDFSMGNVYLKETSRQYTKDSIVIATVDHGPNGGRVNNNNNGRNDTNDGNTGGGSGGNTGGGSGGNTGGGSGGNTGGDTGGGSDSGSQKVTICHKRGNAVKGTTIEVATAALQAHLDHGDKIGPCDGTSTSSGTKGNSGNNGKNAMAPYTVISADGRSEKVYGSVSAILTTFRKTVTSSGLMSMQIVEAGTNKILYEQKFPGEFVWEATWGYFNGDERALSSEQLAMCKRQEVPPPSRDEMFSFLSKPIFSRVTSEIRNFYDKW